MHFRPVACRGRFEKRPYRKHPIPETSPHPETSTSGNIPIPDNHPQFTHAMQPHPQLIKYYHFWDEFLRGWLNRTVTCPPHGDTFDTRRHQLMPEPWWGWTGNPSIPLHAVVINLSPADTPIPDTSENLRNLVSPDWSYSASMNPSPNSPSTQQSSYPLPSSTHLPETDASTQLSLRDALPETDAWYLEKRAKPLTFFATGGQKLPDPVAHTLSIQLCPWHSGSPDKLLKRFWSIPDSRTNKATNPSSPSTPTSQSTNTLTSSSTNPPTSSSANTPTSSPTHPRAITTPSSNLPADRTLTYFNNIIGFAAQASKLIESKLKNTVIVRCKTSTFINLLSPFNPTPQIPTPSTSQPQSPTIQTTPPQVLTSSTPPSTLQTPPPQAPTQLKGISHTILTFPQWPEIRFICISGCRNNLPTPQNMTTLFQTIQPDSIPPGESAGY